MADDIADMSRYKNEAFDLEEIYSYFEDYDGEKIPISPPFDKEVLVKIQRTAETASLTHSQHVKKSLLKGLELLIKRALNPEPRISDLELIDNKILANLEYPCGKSHRLVLSYLTIRERWGQL